MQCTGASEGSSEENKESELAKNHEPYRMLSLEGVFPESTRPYTSWLLSTQSSYLDYMRTPRLFHHMLP